MSRPLLLWPLLAVACSGAPGSKDGEPSGTAPTGGDSLPTDSEDPSTTNDPPVDGDGDGVTDDLDCDDTDPAVFPGAAEICNGLDDNCSGVADDGVPNDGAGCQDPGPPTFPATLGVLHVTARTGSGTNDGTDDGVDVCLSATDCIDINKPDWNDLESGRIDVRTVEGLGWSRAALDRFTVTTREGDDRWVPECLSVRLDGEPVYCARPEDLYIGTETDEVASWTDPNGLTSQCTTCFDSPLTHGPVVGATTAESATIWLRTDATRSVKLRVAASTDALVTTAPVAYRYPSANTDFTEHIEVFGLRSGTTWHYDVEIEGERVGPWSFTTPPADTSPTRLRMAFGSCAKYDDQPLFGQISVFDPDLFLFIGDNHYGNTGDLSALRQHYRHARARPQRSALLKGRTILATWDDHDFTGNNTDGTDPGKDVALRVFQEYQANGSWGTPDTDGVFSAHRWGDVAIFLLDDRYWRGLEGSILGDAQEAWILDSLEASTATFKLVASGSQWTLEGTSDSWGAFPEAQGRFKQALVDRQIDGVVLLSGDVHRSELRLLAGAPGGYALPELTSSPLANVTTSCPAHSELRACHGDGPNFLLLDIDTTLDDPTLEVAIIDSAGGTRATWTILRSELE